jgi:hypothetical protein
MVIDGNKGSIDLSVDEALILIDRLAATISKAMKHKEWTTSYAMGLNLNEAKNDLPAVVGFRVTN